MKNNVRATEKEKIDFISDYCNLNNIKIFHKDEMMKVLEENNMKTPDSSMRRMLNTCSLGVTTGKEKNPKIYFSNYLGDSQYIVLEEQKSFKEYLKSEIEFMSLVNIRRKRKRSKKPKMTKQFSRLYYPTDPTIKSKVIKDSNFTCFICENKKQSDDNTFIRSDDYVDRYLEGHHIIPMKRQKKFKSIHIDDEWNIAPLCPKHHRKLHYSYGLIREEAVIRLLDGYSRHRDVDFTNVANNNLNTSYDRESILKLLIDNY